MPATFDFPALGKQWADAGDPIATRLHGLIGAIYASKAVRLREVDATSQYSELVTAGLIVKDGSVLGGMEYAILPNPLFLYGLTTLLPGFEGRTLPIDAASAFEWQTMFIAHFDDGQPKWGITELLDRLAYFLLSHVQDRGGDEVFAAVDAVKVSGGRERFAAFFSAYLQLVKERPPASPDLVWQLALHFGGEMGPPQGIDLAWGELAEAVASYAHQNPDAASTLEDRALAVMSSPSLATLGLAVISGLHQAGRIGLAAIISYLDSPEREGAVLQLLMVVNLSTVDEQRAVLVALRSYLVWAAAISPFFPLVVTRIMALAAPAETEIISACCEILSVLLARPEEPLQRATLMALAECRSPLPSVLRLVEEFVKMPGGGTRFASVFDFFLFRHRSAAAFFPLIKAYARAVPLGRFHAFNSSLTVTRHADPVDFDRQLLEMVTDDEGPIRWVGHQLLAMAQKGIPGFMLSFDPCTWDWKRQYRYCTSLFEGFWEPQYLIPLVVPLLASTSDVILEVLAVKLEEYAEDYNATVVEVFEAKADQSTPYNLALAGRLRLHLEDLNTRWREKMAIKELHPQNTQSVMMRRFMNYYQKRSRKQMEKTYRETSVMAQLAQTVAISRGGGWRIGESSDVQSLNTVSVAMSLPRSIFIRPEANDMVFKSRFLHNWKEDYQRWEQTISL